MLDAHRGAEGDRRARLPRAAHRAGAGARVDEASRPASCSAPSASSGTCCASSARRRIRDRRRSRCGATRSSPPPRPRSRAARSRGATRRREPRGVVCTVGVVNVEPEIVTAVPGVCEISLDQRALDAGRARADAGATRAAAVGPRRARQQRDGRVARACGASSRARSIRDADAAVRGSGARGNRRRAAAAVGPAARRRRNGAAHAGGDDVRLLVERAVALQGRGHAGAAPRNDVRAYLRAGRENDCPRRRGSNVAETAMGSEGCPTPTRATWGSDRCPTPQLRRYFVQSPRRLPVYFIVIVWPARFIVIVPTEVSSV